MLNDHYWRIHFFRHSLMFGHEWRLASLSKTRFQRFQCPGCLEKRSRAPKETSDSLHEFHAGLWATMIPEEFFGMISRGLKGLFWMGFIQMFLKVWEDVPKTWEDDVGWSTSWFVARSCWESRMWASVGTDLCPTSAPLDCRFLVPTVLVLSPWCSQVWTDLNMLCLQLSSCHRSSVVPCPSWPIPGTVGSAAWILCTEGVRPGPLFWTSNFYSSGQTCWSILLQQDHESWDMLRSATSYLVADGGHLDPFSGLIAMASHGISWPCADDRSKWSCFIANC